MAQKVSYIPTLQEFMKKRRKTEAQSPSCINMGNCLQCEYHKGKDVCLWGGSLKIISIMKVCPITHKELV